MPLFSMDPKNILYREHHRLHQCGQGNRILHLVAHISLVALNDRGTHEWMDNLTEREQKNGSLVHRRREEKARVITKQNK